MKLAIIMVIINLLMFEINIKVITIILLMVITKILMGVWSTLLVAIKLKFIMFTVIIGSIQNK